MTEDQYQMMKASATLEGPKHQPPVGWLGRVGIVWMAVTLIWLAVGQIATAVFGEDYSRGGHVLRAIMISGLVIPLIITARRHLDRRGWVGLGLDSMATGRRSLLIGMLCWLIPAAIGMVICLVMGWTQIRLDVAVIEMLGLSIGLAILVFFYEALPEELIFRGYLYGHLATRLPIWVAIVGQAVLFMLWGLLNGGENSLDRSVLFFGFAIVVGILRVMSGSLWVSIGFHLAFQTVAQLLGDIGGQFRIDGLDTLMVFGFVIIPFTLALMAARWLYPTTTTWWQREVDGQTTMPQTETHEALHV